MLLAAVGIDGNGEKHPLGVIEGATENTAVVQALLAPFSLLESDVACLASHCVEIADRARYIFSEGRV